MSDSPVSLSPSGPPETVLPDESPAAEAALAEATALDPAARPDAVAGVCERYPTMLAAWAELGDLCERPALAYACYRTGYHRGLDRLRASGWRGSGYVRWRHRSNRGFLRCLAGLARVAAEIGEDEEAERCHLFGRQLDPDGFQAISG